MSGLTDAHLEELAGRLATALASAYRNHRSKEVKQALVTALAQRVSYLSLSKENQ